MGYLIGLIAGLIGMLFFQNSSKKSANALLQTLQVDKKEDSLDDSLAKNAGELNSEQQTQDSLEQKGTSNDKDSLDNLDDFFNNNK
jgi:hypothetical protein